MQMQMNLYFPRWWTKKWAFEDKQQCHTEPTVNATAVIDAPILKKKKMEKPPFNQSEELLQHAIQWQRGGTKIFGVRHSRGSWTHVRQLGCGMYRHEVPPRRGMPFMLNKGLEMGICGRFHRAIGRPLIGGL